MNEADHPISAASSQVPENRRRQKAQVSCTVCRARKLRCDRKKPCQSCSTRGLAVACTYVTNPSLRTRVRSAAPLITSSAVLKSPARHESQVSAHAGDEASNQLHQLSPSDQIANSSRLDRVGEPASKLGTAADEISYIGEGHWESIIGNTLESVNGDAGSPYESRETEPDLLFSHKKSLYKGLLLDALPPKVVVDILVERFMSGTEVSVIIHGPLFWKEYEDFWEQPDDVSIPWLALLYGMMNLAYTIVYDSREPPKLHHRMEDTVNIFRRKAAECLLYSDYTKPTTYTMEALIIYLASEMARSQRFSFSISVILSIVIQTALRLGYHRDPSHYPRLSFAEGEMRKRKWLVINFLDCAIASQTGLPRQVRNDQSDTSLPSSFSDDDLEKKQATGWTELEPGSSVFANYWLVRAQSITIEGQIDDLVNSTRHIPYSEVERLDGLLHELIDMLPRITTEGWASSHHANWQSMKTRQHVLDLTLQKSRCLLHRKFLSYEASNSESQKSRNTCIGAAARILLCQKPLESDARGGKQADTKLWKTSFLVGYAFLLAATIICVELLHDFSLGQEPEFRVTRPGRKETETWDREDLLGLLKSSLELFEKNDTTSTKKARQLLAVKLKAIEEAKDVSKSQNIDLSTVGFDITPQYIDSDVGTIPSNIYQNDYLEKYPYAAIDWPLWDSQFSSLGDPLMNTLLWPAEPNGSGPQ